MYGNGGDLVKTKGAINASVPSTVVPAMSPATTRLLLLLLRGGSGGSGSGVGALEVLAVLVLDIVFLSAETTAAVVLAE
jgi:hypothetical protein